MCEERIKLIWLRNVKPILLKVTHHTMDPVVTISLLEISPSTVQSTPHPSHNIFPKKYRSVNRSITSMHDAELIKKKLGMEFELSITYLSKIIPKLNLYIAPVLSVANENKKDIGDCNIKEME